VAPCAAAAARGGRRRRRPVGRAGIDSCSLRQAKAQLPQTPIFTHFEVLTLIECIKVQFAGDFCCEVRIFRMGVRRRTLSGRTEIRAAVRQLRYATLLPW
jgi:hypothetical protein